MGSLTNEGGSSGHAENLSLFRIGLILESVRFLNIILGHKDNTRSQKQHPALVVYVTHVMHVQLIEANAFALNTT